MKREKSILEVLFVKKKLKFLIFFRNFPTKDQLEKKIEINKDKSERGEVLSTKDFGRFGNNKRKKQNRRGTNKRQRLEEVSFVFLIFNFF